MNCDEVLALMQQQLDAPLSPQQLTALQAHLAACESCRQTQSQLRQIDEALRQTTLEPPAQLHDVVMRRIGAPSKQKKRRFWRSAIALAAAIALVFLAGYAGWITLPGFGDNSAVSVSIGSAAEGLLAQAQTPTALCAALTEETDCEVLWFAQCAALRELEKEDYETVLSDARLYLVSAQLASDLQATYAERYLMQRFAPAQPAQDDARVYVLLTP